MSPLTRPSFTPPRWFRSPHLQTMGSVAIPRRITIFPSKDREFVLADGSKLVAECSWHGKHRNHFTLVVMHGLNGSTISSYMRGLAGKAFAMGFNVVRLNMRNAGGNAEVSRTLTHAGQSGDIQTVVQELIEKDKLPAIGLVAFSFSGNLCLSALADWGAKAPKELRGMVGISPLVDLAAMTEALDTHAPAMYRRQLLTRLRATMRERAKAFPGKYNLEEIKKLHTLRAWDNYFAAENGFKDASDYYAQTSVLPHLNKVKVPTLLIHAEDDPAIPAHSFTKIHNSCIEIMMTKYGGHGGFIAKDRNGDLDTHWAENRAIEFFQQLMLNEKPR